MKHYAISVGLALLVGAGVVYAQEGAVDAVETTSIIAEEGVPGGAVVSTLEVEAKVVEIDQEARTAVLQTPSGATMPIAVPVRCA